MLDHVGSALQRLLALVHESELAGRDDAIDSVIAEAEAVLDKLDNLNAPGFRASVEVVAKVDEARRKQLGIGLVPLK